MFFWIGCRYSKGIIMKAKEKRIQTRINRHKYKLVLKQEVKLVLESIEKKEK